VSSSNPTDPEARLRQRIDTAIAGLEPTFSLSVPESVIPRVDAIIADYNRRGWKVEKVVNNKDHSLVFSRLPRYFNPPSQVGEGLVGRLLMDTDQRPAPFEHYANQVRQGEHLYTYLHDTFTERTLVAWAGHPEEYATFYGQYRRGAFEIVKFYALSEEEVSTSEEQ